MKKTKEEEIKEIIEGIDFIFSPLNKEFCPKCKGYCCNGCACNNGYFHSNPIFNKLKKEYQYDNKKGFLTENGCSLPREKRSGICLRHMCHHFNDKLEKEIIDVHVKVSGKDFTYTEFLCNIAHTLIVRLTRKLEEIRGY